MLKPVLVAGPAAAVVDFDEAVARLRLDEVDDDQAVVIASLIEAAIALLDGWSGILGRCLVNQDWRQDFGGLGQCLRLPFPDVSAVAVTYRDASNVSQTIDAAGYQLLEDERGGFVRFVDDFAYPSTYSRPDAVSVTLTAGYGATGASVPAPIRTAILLLVGHWFQNREAVAPAGQIELPLGVKALLQPYSRVGV